MSEGYDAFYFVGPDHFELLGRESSGRERV
jgi:hypothetical protein